MDCLSSIWFESPVEDLCYNRVRTACIWAIWKLSHSMRFSSDWQSFITILSMSYLNTQICQNQLSIWIRINYRPSNESTKEEIYWVFDSACFGGLAISRNQSSNSMQNGRQEIFSAFFLHTPSLTLFDHEWVNKLFNTVKLSYNRLFSWREITFFCSKFDLAKVVK